MSDPARAPSSVSVDTAFRVVGGLLLAVCMAIAGYALTEVVSLGKRQEKAEAAIEFSTEMRREIQRDLRAIQETIRVMDSRLTDLQATAKRLEVEARK